MKQDSWKRKPAATFCTAPVKTCGSGNGDYSDAGGSERCSRKTALCISDTYETSWISECMDKGSRVVLLRSGLARFSGKEKPAYRNRVMNYYRQILEYGVEICSVDEFTGRAPYESPGHSPAGETASGNDTQHPDTKKKGLYHRPMWNSLHPAVLYSFSKAIL